MTAAQHLAEALLQDRLVEPVSDEALVTPEAIHELAEAARAAVPWPVAGWKIGATSAKARAIMGTDEPFFGPVFRPRVFGDGDTLTLPPGFLGFECELALRLGAELPAKHGGYDPATLAIAIDAVILAIELVATRQRLPSMGDARRAAADFGFNHGLVLGPVLAPPPIDRLAEVGVTAFVDGTEVGTGSGADVLGHPLRALAWLTRQGVDLHAGELISTGTCTGIATLAKGQRAGARYRDGDVLLGEVGFTAG